MKILYYSSPSFADCDFPLVKEFIRLGHEVAYLINLTPYSLKSTLFNIEKQLPVNDIIAASSYRELDVYSNYMDMSKVYIVNRTAVKDSSLQNLSITLKLISFIKKGNFDVVHTDCFFRFYDILLYQFKNKLVQTFHDPFIHSGESSYKSTFFRKIAIKCIPKIVLLNDGQKDKFAELNHISKSRIYINRLGVYDCINAFKPKDEAKENKNVLFFGRISPYKGIEYLLEAMNEVHKVIPDAQLTIAGGGKIYFNVEKYEKLDYVKLINRYIGMEELADLLHKSYIVVCPYTDATQSGVVMTAFALNKPVIASNVGGMSESVHNGVNGLLVAPKDVNALSNAIISVLNNSILIKNIQKNINDEYHEGINSWKNIARKYINCYLNKI